MDAKRAREPPGDDEHDVGPSDGKPCPGVKKRGCKHSGALKKMKTGRYTALCDRCRGPSYMDSKKPPKAEKKTTEETEDDLITVQEYYNAVPMPFFINTKYVIAIRELCRKHNRPDLCAFVEPYCDGPKQSGTFITDAKEIEAYETGAFAFMDARIRERVFGDIDKVADFLQGKKKSKPWGKGGQPVMIPRMPNFQETEEHQLARERFNFEFNGIPPPLPPNLSPRSLVDDNIYYLRMRRYDATPHDYSEILSDAPLEDALLWLEMMKKKVPERVRHLVTFKLLADMYKVVVLGMPVPPSGIMGRIEATDTPEAVDTSDVMNTPESMEVPEAMEMTETVDVPVVMDMEMEQDEGDAMRVDGEVA